MLVSVLKGNAPDGSFILPEGTHITKREISALVMVANGIDNQDAAKKFGIGVNTFRNHVFNVMQKLGANNRAHAIILAIQNGIIEVVEKKKLGYSHDIYYLCISCERAFSSNEVLEVEGKTVTINHVKTTLSPDYFCPYEGCHELATLGIKWEDVRQYHPEYTNVPEHGVKYDFDLNKYLVEKGYVREVIEKE